MFGKGSTSYEVQSRREGRWSIQGAFTDQEASLSCARSLLAAGGVEEVKVIKYRTLAGLSLETVILHKKAPEVKTKPLILGGTAEGAPICRTLEDLRGFDSRVVIGRLLRPFLDRLRITPTELLHSWSHFRKLDEQGALLSAAIHATARHHADLHGTVVATRVKELRRLVDAAASEARDFLAERKNLPSFNPQDLEGTSHRIDLAVGEDGHDALFLSLLTLQLIEGGTLTGKLDLVLDMISDDIGPRHLILLDGVMADILGSADTLKELLGPQPSLFMGLCALVDALYGRNPDPVVPQPTIALSRVCELTLRGRAPLSRIVLIDRLRQTLLTDQPLDRRDAKAEGALIQDLIQRLKGPDDQPLGGAAVAKALERRMVRHRQAILREQGMHHIADQLSGA